MGKASLLCDTIADLAAEVIGFVPDRIKQGYVPFTQSEEFLNDLPDDGFYLVIHDSEETEFNAGTFELGTYEIKLTIYYGFDKTAAYDYREIRNARENLRRKLLSQESWDGISNGPKTIRQEKSDLTTKSTVVAKTIEMTLVFETN